MGYKIFPSILIFVFLIGVIGIVSAATCVDEQRIMRLYQPTNSHGAIWNYEGGYNYEICSPNGEDINRDCGTSILYLFDNVGNDPEYNSHVSTVSGDGYDILICGLENCVVTAAGSCGGDVLLSLYSEYNSHLAIGGNVLGYDFVVCCGATGTYWADANGNPITSSEVWDVVKLIVIGAGNPGDLVNFSVVEEKLSDEWIFGGDGYEFLESVVNANGDAVGVWRISQSDYDKTSESEDHNDYYFYAFDNVGSEIGKSDKMSIAAIGTDSPMSLKIIEPLCGDDLMLGEERDVIVDVSDIDDIVTGTLQINGESYEVTNGVATFNHVFDKAGNIQIVIDAVNTRGQEKQVITNIMVIDPDINDVYVAACIDKPEDYEDIKGSVVLFDARSTRAIQYDISLPLEERAVPIEYKYMTFHWTFSDGRIHPSPEGSDPLSYLFYKTFTQAGDNWAELAVELGF